MKTLLLALVLIGCSNPFEPTEKLTPDDPRYWNECVFYAAEGHVMEVAKTIPRWYFERCDPVKILEVKFT